jgi:ribosome maturation factor RimP
LGAEVEVREEVHRLAQPLCEDDGFELVSVELVFQGRRMVIRVLLDKPGGITVGDCGRFSRRLAECMDMNQIVAGSYQLEVSSPGIERPLTTLEAVSRFAGQRASVTLREAREGRRNWEGVLLEPNEGRVGLRTDEGDEPWFEWAEVRSARLIVDPWAASRKGTERPAREPRWGGHRKASGGGRHE